MFVGAALSEAFKPSEEKIGKLDAIDGERRRIPIHNEPSLYLQVSGHPGAPVISWLFRYRTAAGKQVNHTIGRWPEVSWAEVPVYFAGQFIGAALGAIFVWLAYLPHWGETPDQGLKLAVFSTGPAIRNSTANLICEIIGTFALMFGVFEIQGAQMVSGGAVSSISLGALGALPVALLVWVIGLSLGGPTGYAINPARDLAPRIMHAILPIAGKGDSDWGYSWIPVVGPIVGAAIAAFLFMMLPH